MQAWLQNQWNEPSRSDHYLMRIAQRVERVLSSDPAKIGLDTQKVDFVFKQKPNPKFFSPEEQKRKLDIHKAIWKAAVGLGVKNDKRRRS